MLTEKVCLITGGTRGIGKAIAQLYAENGASVVITGRNDEAEWADTWNSTHSNKLFYYVCDVTDERQCFDTISAIKKKMGRLDVLVNNAGIEYNEKIGMISTDHMKEMFSVNVYGAIYMLQLSARIMKRQENGGSIINIASVVGTQGNAGQLVYSATKGAVISMTKSAAKELAADKVRVNAVAPGLTNTEMIQKTAPEHLKNRISKIAFGYPAKTKDIANACLFLASDMSAYITGQILGVDGGTSL